MRYPRRAPIPNNSVRPIRLRAIFCILAAHFVLLLAWGGGPYDFLRTEAVLIAIWACMGNTRPLVRWPISIAVLMFLIVMIVWAVPALNVRYWAGANRGLQEMATLVVEVGGLMILLEVSLLGGARIENGVWNRGDALGRSLHPFWGSDITAITLIALFSAFLAIVPLASLQSNEQAFLCGGLLSLAMLPPIWLILGWTADRSPTIPRGIRRSRQRVVLKPPANAPRRWQFSMRQMFALSSLTAAICALWRYLPYNIHLNVAQAVLVVLAVHLVLNRGSMTWRLTLLAVLAPSIMVFLTVRYYFGIAWGKELYFFSLAICTPLTMAKQWIVIVAHLLVARAFGFCLIYRATRPAIPAAV